MAASSMRGRCALLAVLAALVSGCSTNPITGRSQFVIFTEEQAIGRATLAYSGMMSDLRGKGRIVAESNDKTRVDRITDGLIAHASRYRPETRNWSWEVNIVESSDINAFCMPGGKMAVYTGLLEKIEPTDDELAQVMGHEIGHALANHGAEKMSVQFASDLAVVAIAAAASRDRYDFESKQAALALGALAAIKLPNSREAEDEADKIGIELAARGGYDPRAAVTLWEKMIAQTGNNSRFDFLNTHPAGPKRIERMQAMMPHMMAIYEGKDDAPIGGVMLALNAPPGGAVPGKAGGSNSLATAGVSTGSPSRLTFFSEDFERFKAGNANFDCIGNCALSWGYNRSQLKKWYDAGDWRPLATKVTSIGFDHDISYFYLGRAAESLGYAEPARHYYEVAIEKAKIADTACRGRFLDICEGIDVVSDAQSALDRLSTPLEFVPSNVAAAQPEQPAPAMAVESPRTPEETGKTIVAAAVPSPAASTLVAEHHGAGEAANATAEQDFLGKSLAGSRQLSNSSWGDIYVELQSMTMLSGLAREYRLATITTYHRAPLVQRDTWEINCATRAVKWHGWTKYSRTGEKVEELTFSPPQAALGGLPADSAAHQLPKLCEW